MKINLPVTQKELPLDNDCIILSTTDAKGCITYVNDEFIKYSGFEEQELLGKSHNVVRHPDMPPQAFDNLWSTIKSNKPWMGLVKNRCKNGDHYWVNAIVTPIVRSGQITEYQSIRTKASREDIDRAERIYRKLSANKGESRVARFQLGMLSKLWLGFFISLAPIIAYVLSTADINRIWFGLVTVLTVVIAGGSFWMATRHIRSAVQYAENIVDNPLMEFIYTNSNSESSKLIFAMKMLQKKIHSVSGRIQDSSSHLKNASFNLTNAVALNRKGVTHQDSESAKLVSAMEELHVTSTQVTDNVQSATKNLDQVSVEANQGQAIVNQAVDQMNNLWKQVDDSTEVIGSLQSDSENIGKILDVIKEIAGQTNLLALNAAIEAARAGEQGRGFSVVASEVRTLAARTQESTLLIEQLIAQLQNRTNEVVHTMSSSRELADASVKQIAEAGSALANISEAISRIAHHNSEINNMSQGQMNYINNVSINVMAINEINELSIETAVSLESIAGEVGELSHGLLELINSLSR